MLWLAMRFVDGADLRSLVAAARSRRARAAIVAQVGAALDAAHARRLVHRDVKPANVLVDGGDHAYLTDFGLVKALDETAGLTRTGEVVGTLDYVAPERIRGEGDGPAARPVLARLRAVLRADRAGRVRGRGRRAQAVGAPVRAAAGGAPPGVRRGDRARAGEGPGGAVRERRGARSGGAGRGGAARGPRRCSTAARAQRARDPRGRGPGAGRRGARTAAGRAGARRASARGLLREALADTPPEQRRAAARRGARGRGPGQGAARRRARPAARGAAPDARGARRPSTPRSSGSWSSSRPSAAACWPTTPRPASGSARCRTSSRRSPTGWPPQVGNPPPRVAVRRARGGPTIRAMTHDHPQAAPQGPAPLHRDLRVPRGAAHKLSEELGDERNGRHRPRRPARLVPRLPLRRRRADRHALHARSTRPGTR